MIGSDGEIYWITHEKNQPLNCFSLLYMALGQSFSGKTMLGIRIDGLFSLCESLIYHGHDSRQADVQGSDS